MAWDQNLVKMRDVLADLYPTEADSRRIVRQAGVDSRRIYFSPNTLNNWSEIIEEARKQNKLRALFDAAYAEYPTNPEFGKAYSEYLATFLISNFNLEPIKNLERLMGKENTLLPISWLEVGLKRSHAVARVITGEGGYATGFLVAQNLFITNNHVLDSPAKAKDAKIEFNYQQDEGGVSAKSVLFSLDPDITFKTSVEDDWTIVKVQGEANSEWGAIPLKPVAVKVGDYANIIQHAEGEQKRIGLYHNTIDYVDEKRVRYSTDTMRGSSGSPVFNSTWDLIALHYRWIDVVEPQTQKPGHRNEGIHISCLLSGLKQNGISF